MKPRIFSKQPGVVQMKADGKTAEILIYDEIGEGWFGGLGSKEFVQQLTALGEVDTINVRINSPGGDVFEGVAIYNALKMHPATVNVQVDALAASIATVIAMAGDTITIAPTAMMMVHNPMAMAFGEADDLIATANLLNKLRDTTMMTAYARTEIPNDELKAIMAAETWYSGQEAVDAGWADGFAEPPAGKSFAGAKYDLSAFKHPPQMSDRVTEPTDTRTPKEREAERLAAEARVAVRNRLRKEHLRLAEL